MKAAILILSLAILSAIGTAAAMGIRSSISDTEITFETTSLVGGILFAWCALNSYLRETIFEDLIKSVILAVIGGVVEPFHPLTGTIIISAAITGFLANQGTSYSMRRQHTTHRAP